MMTLSLITIRWFLDYREQGEIERVDFAQQAKQRGLVADPRAKNGVAVGLAGD